MGGGHGLVSVHFIFYLKYISNQPTFAFVFLCCSFVKPTIFKNQSDLMKITAATSAAGFLSSLGQTDEYKPARSLGRRMGGGRERVGVVLREQMDGQMYGWEDGWMDGGGGSGTVVGEEKGKRVTEWENTGPNLSIKAQNRREEG